MIDLRRRTRGQAILMVTLALFALAGLLGLAVDLGWAYYVKKSAQSAADAAALGAAYQALAQVGETGTYTATNVTVQGSVAPCDLSGNLHNGCQYAQQNGFSHGGNGGRQDVTMLSGINSAPPTVPSISADYWVTVRVSETIPQLFSTLLGNSVALASARATGAVVPTVVNGSVILLNRANDPPPAGKKSSQGNDLQMGGGDQIIAPAGVVIASMATNAGTTNGNAHVVGPVTVLMPGNASAVGTNVRDLEDGPQFLDPMAGAGQPPLTGSVLPTYAVPTGQFSNGVFQLNPSTNTLGNPVPVSALPSGNYVAVTCPQAGGCSTGATANVASAQLTINTAVSFTSSAFGNYLFYGGLNLSRSTMNLGPGEYVMVGGGPNGSNGDLNADNNAYLHYTGGTGSAGAILILTGSSSSFNVSGGTVTGNSNGDLYPGLLAQINSNPLLVGLASAGSLAFGPVSLLAGSDQASAAVSGLDPANVTLPANLKPFGGVVLWQDQANSPLKYLSDGNIDTSCNDQSIDNPCTKTLANANSPGFTFQANPTAGLTGVVYQPRGAWISTQGGQNAGIQGAVQIISGAILMQGHGTISTTPPLIPLKRRVAALIE